MTTLVGSYVIETQQTRKQGSPWTVRLYKKSFLFRKTVSSDWFLNEQQAKGFADQLAKDLEQGKSVQDLKQRKPGWTLHRAAH
jgi:hypothetical protein